MLVLSQSANPTAQAYDVYSYVCVDGFHSVVAFVVFGNRGASSFVFDTQLLSSSCVSEAHTHILLTLTKPSLHCPILHSPLIHAAAALETEQIFLHSPQLSTSEFVFISHPSSTLLLQFAYPSLQEITQDPCTQVVTPFSEEHLLLYAPQ